MVCNRVIVIGASAGGVEPLIQLCRLLPSDLTAAVFIVLHTAPHSPSYLAQILQRKAAITITYPKNGDAIEPGKVYVAPPNRHLVLHAHHIELSSGPRENLLRPSADVLFRSAAKVFGPRVIGVVLSGTRNDGTAGLIEIQEQGGVTIIQDPQEALFPGMPESAFSHVRIDYVLTIEAMAEMLVKLAGESVTTKRQGHPMNSENAKENRMIEADKESFSRTFDDSQRTLLTCPECGGTLWEVHENGIIRYVCHVGHALSESGLIDGQDSDVEKALWVAVRALEERAFLARRMANRAKSQGRDLIARRFEQRVEEAEKNATLVREIILNSGTGETIDEP